jgi:hypothetical protein
VPVDKLDAAAYVSLSGSVNDLYKAKRVIGLYRQVLRARKPHTEDLVL